MDENPQNKASLIPEQNQFNGFFQPSSYESLDNQ